VMCRSCHSGRRTGIAFESLKAIPDVSGMTVWAIFSLEKACDIQFLRPQAFCHSGPRAGIALELIRKYSMNAHILIPIWSTFQ
jgi:hypothetical protein